MEDIMNPQREDREITGNSAYNPFPKPQTGSVMGQKDQSER